MGSALRVWLLAAGCASLLPAVPAQADELPPPVIRPSVRRVAPTLPARPAPTPASARPARTAELPYRLPYAPPRSPAALPVSAPARTVARSTHVPAMRPDPRAPTPVRAALPQPSVRAGLPACAPPAAPAASRRLATGARSRTSATSPRRRAAPYRTVPRRLPVRRFDLAVPCAPGQAPPPAPTRCRLPFVRPPGCTEDG